MDEITATSDEPTASSISSIPLLSPSQRTPRSTINKRANGVVKDAFRFRRWLEDEKHAIQEGEQEIIAKIEGRLPTLKGQGANVVDYVAKLEKYKRHKWDMERARHYEYQLIADRLLGIAGGSIGRPRDSSNPALIGAGLAKFSTRSEVSSLSGFIWNDKSGLRIYTP
ncbi:hypothetical protein KI688_007236 [Linnemannia hyalina]|uniref:Uncharacterized protein n=1 Tax=Linnemannia hyalina TaxID=64524 RepID=A0A9P7XHZ2_9FUNG|nr:hypothetical protein KI688_007236 [Linnemannia hyalina]